MRGSQITGWALLLGGLLAAVVIAYGLYAWDAQARAAEAQLRPQPVAPLAVSTPARAPVVALAASPQVVAVPSGGSGDAAAGQAIFQTKCTLCHPNGNAGIGPALNGAAFTTRYPYNAAIGAMVRGGRDGMPPFAADGLSDADLNNVVAYLRSL